MTLRPVACQTLLSMGFSRQEHWSGLPCPTRGFLPTQGLNPCLLHLLYWQAGSLQLAPSGKPLLKGTNWQLIKKSWRSNAAAAAKSLQSCLTLCDPIDGSPPGSPSLGFSRQEHWSELPFPSPMHESEK